MAITELSLAVVGADYSRRGEATSRRFELAMCIPGEPVELVPEPNNPADERAIAVHSLRGIMIGYISAERCGWLGAQLRAGRDACAIFQKQTRFGGVIRVGFDGHVPELPDEQPEDAATIDRRADDSGFWPDDLPPDD